MSRGASRGDRRVWNQKLAGGTTVRSIRGLRGVCRAQLLAAVRTVFRAPQRPIVPRDSTTGKGLNENVTGEGVTSVHKFVTSKRKRP